MIKHLLLFLSVFFFINSLSFSQNRIIARGAEPGELYLNGFWYGIYAPPGPPYYDTLQMAVYRITENGKKLTIQYDADYFANYEYIMQPQYILVDATPGVIYNVQHYSKNSYSQTALWVSFDYGKIWIFREENMGSKGYAAANAYGFIYRGGSDGLYKSIDFGLSFENIPIPTPIYGVLGECGLESCEFWNFSGSNYSFQLVHTMDCRETYVFYPIDSQYVFGSISGVSPDVYRGSNAGEVYVSSLFPDPNYYVTYKVSFSADTGSTFRHVFVSESYANGGAITPLFMSDREPGIFYIIRRYEVEDFNPWGHHTKLCIEYYRDYGETLEATFCHNITKNYEYEEVVCDNTTSLISKIENQNSIQLQWSNSAESSLIRGYHLYRNNVRITSELLIEATYIDEDLPAGNYEYYVKTYYKEGCVSDSSNHVTETIALGVKGLKDLEGVILFPNPTSGELTITNYELRINDVEVFDVYGKKLSSYHLITSSSHHLINISHLSAGIYFIRATTEQGVITKKVVKY